MGLGSLRTDDFIQKRADGFELVGWLRKRLGQRGPKLDG